ncbi:hypothetical protein [Kitasatospora sp. P5_F3]
MDEVRDQHVGLLRRLVAVVGGVRLTQQPAQPPGELLIAERCEGCPEPVAQQPDRYVILLRRRVRVAQEVPLPLAVGFEHHLLEQIAAQVRAQHLLPVVHGQGLLGSDLEQNGVAVHHQVDS